MQYHRQAGFFMTLLLILIVVTVGAIITTQLLPSAKNSKYDQKTNAALAKAKAALLAYASSHPLQFLPGLKANDYLLYVLPCPDVGRSLREGEETGTCEAANVSSLGRFPWKTLMTSVLQDSSNECLWYAVSGAHKSSPFSFTTMINEDTPPLLSVVNDKGSSVTGTAPDDQVMAVIFAPGALLPGQNRSLSTINQVDICGGNYVASNYLDSLNNINNAITNPNAYGPTTFIQTPLLANFNDKLVTITRKEVMAIVGKRTDFVPHLPLDPTAPVPIMAVLAQTLAECVKTNRSPVLRPTSVNLGNSWSDYANSGNYLPQNTLLVGRLPASWVINNCTLNEPQNFLYSHWKDHFFYVVSNSFVNTPSASNFVTCISNDCLTINGNANQYAALIIYSGSHLGGQTRDGTALGDINQYLEGRNASNFATGDKNYQLEDTSNTFNDFIVCIQVDLTKIADLCPK